MAQQQKRGRPATVAGPQIALRVPEDMLQAMDAIASRLGVSRSDAVRFALRDYIRREGKISPLPAREA